MSSAAPPRIETPRLRLRLPTGADAPFFLELLNDAEFMRFTGDRGIRDLAGAEDYVTNRLLPLYQKIGYTLLTVEQRADGVPIGICGWVQRDYLDGPDLGYGYLQRFSRQGYGTEAAAATMAHGRTALGLDRVHAITMPINHGSIRLLTKLGFRIASRALLPAGSNDLLFSCSLANVVSV